MMSRVYFITHPDVVVDPTVPVPDWPLSPRGRERMGALLRQPWTGELTAVYASDERKARDGAEILAAHTGLPVQIEPALGENDRSSTGYLPQAVFQAIADAFFAQPEISVRGWERAIDAQRRIVRAVFDIAARAPAGAAVAVVSHGGVGTLLLCHLERCAISRTREQPGTVGGNYFTFDARSGALLHGWTPIDAAAG
jgi:broad specificity phosphatase PhoE